MPLHNITLVILASVFCLVFELSRCLSARQISLNMSLFFYLPLFLLPCRPRAAPLPHHLGWIQVFMTPEDFVRSLTPGAMQPEGLGLDQFNRIDPKKYKAKSSSTLPEDSIFFKLTENGLLTFSGKLICVYDMVLISLVTRLVRLVVLRPDPTPC